MTLVKALHLRYGINRLSVKKRRGYTSIEDFIDATIQGLKKYAK